MELSKNTPEQMYQLPNIKAKNTQNKRELIPQPHFETPIYERKNPEVANKDDYETFDRKQLRNNAYKQIYNPPMLPQGNHSSPKKINHEIENKTEISEISNQEFDYKDKLHGSALNVTYKPYTLQDYKTIKETKYKCLGGLGANIGGNEWLAKRTQMQKMYEFAKKAQLTNQEKLEGLARRSMEVTKNMSLEKEQAKNYKKRVEEYAKKIPKPSGYKINEVSLRKFMQKKLPEEINN